MPTGGKKNVAPRQPTADRQLAAAIARNTRQIAEMRATMDKLHRHLVWHRVWLVLKILIIAVPIVLGAIYLPDYLRRSGLGAFLGSLQDTSEALQESTGFLDGLRELR